MAHKVMKTIFTTKSGGTAYGSFTSPPPPAADALKDLDAYPILTEEVGYPPSPLSKPSGGSSGAPAGTPIGQIAARAISDVLGWKPKDGDAQGFIGALSQAFNLTEIEGHVESKWVPRTYAVQTDLSGGITGAQASVYSRGQVALEQSMPLLDGLYSLDPEATAEDIAALKAVIRSQFTELVNELGFLGGPRISRVNQYFSLLLGAQAYPPENQVKGGIPLTVTDPDEIGGTLGTLREELGVNFRSDDFVNSVEDEQNLSNYRIISDYVTGLAQTWLNNLDYLRLDSTRPFFGTDLVLLSRQLSVIAELVDEVRFTLDSVFIGPAERQTLLLHFTGNEPPMYLEDLLNWAQSFSSDEGPRLITEGGKFGVENTFTPVVNRLSRLIGEAANQPAASVPRGFRTPRVHRSFGQLTQGLSYLVSLSKPIKHRISPVPEFAIPLERLEVLGTQPDFIKSGTTPTIAVFGKGFEFGGGATGVPSVYFVPPGGKVTGSPQAANVYFRSQNCLAVMVPSNLLPNTTYRLAIANPSHSGPPHRISDVEFTVQ